MFVNLPVAPTVTATGTVPAPKGETAAERLGDTFSKLFNDVNNLQLAADDKIEEFATSPDKDIHGTMIALQKADLSLRLFLQIRSKLTAAYQEIMRMQV